MYGVHMCVRARMCVHVCAHVHGDQKPASETFLSHFTHYFFQVNLELVHSARPTGQFAVGIPLPPSSTHWDLLVGRLAWGFRLWPHACMANALLAELSP